MQAYTTRVVTLTGSAQQLSAALLISGTDLVIDGTDTTKVTSAAHTFTAADVGWYLNVTAGTGFTRKAFKIASVTSGAALLDASAGTAGSTAGTYTIGFSGTTDRPIRCFTVQAGTANAGTVKIGDANLASAVYSDLLPIPVSTVPAVPVVYPPTGPWGSIVIRLSDFWVLGTNNDKLTLGIYWA